MAATVPPYSPAGASGGPASSTPAPTITPPGPNAAGLNPAVSGVPATSLDPAIAMKQLPGGGTVGAQPAQAPRPYDEKQLVQELATELGVKATKGKSLENGVIDALAKKYGVTISQSDMTTAGTGSAQGAVGQARHDLADWFDNATPNIVATAVTPPKVAKFGPATMEAAKDIKDPKLRAQFIAKVQAAEAEQQSVEGGRTQDEGQSATDARPVPNTKALNDMLARVGEKLGVGATQLGQSGLANIAKAQGLQTATPATPAVAGAPQTVGDAYQAFIKNLSDPKTGATFAASQVPAFEVAGLLDKNAAGTKQPNGTTFTNTQIASAYQAVLQQQVTQNQSESAALQALASTTATPGGGPTSEMQAYVAGVAQEFGVGLTTQQITQIANTYGANALVAGQPSSVEDEIKDAVVALYDPTNPNNPAGVADTMFTNIQNAALQYQIPISAGQIGNMVKSALQSATVESMYVAADSAQSAAIKQFQQQAQGLYPALSAQIGAGQTVQNLVAPYFNVAEAITGVPSSTMMADQQGGGLSKWSAFLQGGNNPAGATKTAPGTSPTGSAAQAGPQMMTLDEWKKYLMQTPSYGFQNTQGGKDMAEQLTAAILNEFGKVNTTSGAPINLYQGQSALSANTSSL
jgi:hypothetical protein